MRNATRNRRRMSISHGFRMNAMSRPVAVYVRSVLAVQIAILALALFAQTNLALHLVDLSSSLEHLPLGALLASIPVFFLAEERNVWRNEFLRCPNWLRIGCVVAMVYGAIAATFSVAL